MTRSVMTGECTPTASALACLKAYVDLSDEQLAEYGLTREDCLQMAREYIGTGYTDTSLATMFDQLAKAFKVGREKK